MYLCFYGTIIRLINASRFVNPFRNPVQVPTDLPKQITVFPKIEIIDIIHRSIDNHMTQISGFAAQFDISTLYLIIQGDAAIRFDTALRISNILDIPINSICKDNPYEDMETLPKLPSDKERLMINMEKKAYFSDRTLKIIKKFDYTELPMIDQLIAYFYVLDDAARKDVFEYLKIMKKNHSDPKRETDLSV